MNRYDWDWSRGYDAGYGAGAPRPRYGSGFGNRAEGWGGAREPGLFGREPAWGGGRYDRGIYGGGYPGYGGVPGGNTPGMYYGGNQHRGYGYGEMDFRQRGMAGPNRGGYDTGYATQRFIPEDAYRRHPELNQPQRHRVDRWPDAGHAWGGGAGMSDGEIERAVRQSLYQDGYVDAERIQVEVDDQVVTLRGEVDDYLEARYAWDDAWETPGVRGVVNHLTVRTDQPADEHANGMPQTAGGKGAGKKG